MVLALLQDQIKIHMKINHEAQNWVIRLKKKTQKSNNLTNRWRKLVNLNKI